MITRALKLRPKLYSKNPKKYFSVEFLDKINYTDQMNINEIIRDHNIKTHPVPTYVGLLKVIEQYPKMNWKDVKANSDIQGGPVRTKTAKGYANGVLYDPSNPKHKEEGLEDITVYALEDFEAIFGDDVTSEEYRKKMKSMVEDTRTKYGRKYLMRDFRKTGMTQDVRIIELLVQSQATAIGAMARELLAKQAEKYNFDTETMEKVLKLINDAVPEKEEKIKRVYSKSK